MICEHSEHSRTTVCKHIISQQALKEAFLSTKVCIWQTSHLASLYKKKKKEEILQSPGNKEWHRCINEKKNKNTADLNLFSLMHTPFFYIDRLLALFFPHFIWMREGEEEEYKEK